ncbi:ABC transporter permease subunit [candidate division GN15 bacterium]|nr:ABC transporter permease subunit [candidate division GN15 bacterium]
MSVTVTAMTAFPLSNVRLPGRKILIMVFIFAWLFDPGLVPSYLLVRELRLADTLWALILPPLLLVFFMLLMKNYFEGIPEDLIDAARIDGATNTRVLFRIILPISLPVVATISLFYAISYWNSYFLARLYITTPNLKPLQLYLFELVTELEQADQRQLETATDQLLRAPLPSIRAASVLVSVVPIAIVYPFLQKYFAKGLVVGSVKG